jgi:hypothetical protein
VATTLHDQVCIEMRVIPKVSATYNTFYHQPHLLERPMLEELPTTSFEVWQSASVAI